MGSLVQLEMSRSSCAVLGWLHGLTLVLQLALHEVVNDVPGCICWFSPLAEKAFPGVEQAKFRTPPRLVWSG